MAVQVKGQELLRELAKTVKETSACSRGVMATDLLLSTSNEFGDRFEMHYAL